MKDPRTLPLGFALRSIRRASTHPSASDRFAAFDALRVLAAGLLHLVSGREPWTRDDPCTAEALARLNVAQRASVEQIRRLSLRVTGASNLELFEIAGLLRTATISVYRREVRRNRLRGDVNGDAPGGGD